MRKRRKSRIKLTDTLNKQLDSMQDDSALNVFKPCSSKDTEFYKLVDEAMSQESQGEGNKFRTSGKKARLKGLGSLALTLVLFVLFGLFIYLILHYTIL